jgi:uncharacterized RDD family membrane protein YckC
MLFSLFWLVVLVLDIIAWIKLFGGSSSTEHKLIWALVIFFLPVLGMLLYFLIGQKATDA